MLPADPDETELHDTVGEDLVPLELPPTVAEKSDDEASVQSDDEILDAAICENANTDLEIGRQEAEAVNRVIRKAFEKSRPDGPEPVVETTASKMILLTSPYKFTASCAKWRGKLCRPAFHSI